MTEWKPIETAPKDGTKILAVHMWGSKTHYLIIHRADVFPWWLSGSTVVCDESRAGKAVRKNFDFTHWMPLPKPPEAQPND